MPLIVEYSEKAKIDVRLISVWYRDKKDGLDDEFLLSLEATVKAVQRNPLHFKMIHSTIRSASLKRFPYKIYFVIKNDTVVILSVFHTSRSPETILSRFKNED